jgi:hypothetical protein
MNFAGYRLLTKLCLHKSKIAQGMYDQALVVLGQVSVGDQRLHEMLDANAAGSSEAARAFVLGPREAIAQRPPKPVDASSHLGRGQRVKALGRHSCAPVHLRGSFQPL